METIAPFKFWSCLAAIGCGLGTVSALSINAEGPAASHAIIATRVAHLELFWAKIAFRDAAVYEAELHLNEAWSSLGERQYEQSIFAAYHALQRVRDIKGEVPSLYSSRWKIKNDEPGDAAESLTAPRQLITANSVRP
jgi:hypothetical protein